MKLREFFTSEEKWNKDHFYIDEFGNPIDTPDTIHSVKSCCLFGGLYLCYPDHSKRFIIIQKIKTYLKIHYIQVWNDDIKRTFEDIQKLVNELDI